MRAKKMECGVFFLQRDPLRLIELHVNMGKLAGDARCDFIAIPPHLRSKRRFGGRTGPSAHRGRTLRPLCWDERENFWRLFSPRTSNQP
jgi:hypothetical protein